MTHRGWLLGVLALLISASFAGCLGDDDAEPADTGGDIDGNDAIDPGNNTTAAPVAVITVAGNTTVAPDETLSFDAALSTDNDTAVDNLTFFWDFGDNGTAEGVTATHAFVEAGNYTVTLTVADPDNNTGVATTTILVETGFEPGLVETVAGTITAPNPIVGELVLAYPQLSAACPTVLECFQTFGGLEGTHWAVHEVTDLPSGAGAFVFTDNGAGTTPADFAVFDMNGAKLSGNNLGPNTLAGGRTFTLQNPTVDAVQIFVWLHLGASAAYSIDITSVAPDA